MKIILHFVKKEFLQFLRDPKMVRVVFIAPILELILLGYAANMDVEKIHTALLDRSHSQLSRTFVRKLKASGYFYFDYLVEDYKELQKLIDDGKVILGLVIPHDFEEKILRGKTAEIPGSERRQKVEQNSQDHEEECTVDRSFVKTV